MRCNFPVLSTPKGSPDKPDDLKYAITVFFDKKKDAEQIKNLKAYVKGVIAECGGWSAEKKKKIENELLIHVNGDMLNKFALVKDGDAMNSALLADDKNPRPEQAGKWVVSFRNRRAPQVVDQTGKEILGSMIDSSIRSGYWVKLAVSAYTWSKPQSSGAAMQLQGVQLIRKDEEFGKTDCGFEAVEGVDADDTEGGSFDE